MAPIRFVLDGVLGASCDQEAAYARVGADAYFLMTSKTEDGEQR